MVGAIGWLVSLFLEPWWAPLAWAFALYAEAQVSMVCNSRLTKSQRLPVRVRWLRRLWL